MIRTRPPLALVTGLATGWALSACSTVNLPGTPTFCETDDQCKRSQICFEGICQEPPDRPPLGTLALAVSEGDYEVELLGCEVEADEEALVVSRGDFVDTVELSYLDWIEVMPAICPSGYDAREDVENVCAGPFPARFTVRQPSRLGRRPLSASKLFMPEGDGEATEPTPVSFSWAHYPPAFATSLPEPVVAVEDLRPPEALAGVIRSRLERVLVRDNDAPTVYASEVISRRRCHRFVEGRVARFASTETVALAKVDLAWAEAVAAPSSVLLESSPTTCDDDDDCPPGRACSPDFMTCGLDLENTAASSGAFTDDTGAVELPIYSYCELQGSPEMRHFRVLAGPDDPQLGLPKLRYDLEQPLEPGLAGAVPPLSDAMPGTLCTVDWLASREIRFDVGASPRRLLELEDPDRVWTCCDTSCLPTEEDLSQTLPPTPPERCTNFASITFSTNVAPPAAPQDWEDAGCLPLVEDGEGYVGSFSAAVSPSDPDDPDPDCTDGTCRAWLTQGSVGATRSYEVRMEQPVGSLFRSSVGTVTVDADTVTLPAMELQPRVVLEGTIVCGEDIEDCEVARATVFAERLRESDEDPAEVVGPFFYSTQSLADGTFFLPVNPGVYVITARPEPGALGGPSEYRIVDLREDAPNVTAEGGLLRRPLDPLALEAGRPVRIRLDGFDSSTRVEPFDTGSWRAQSNWPRDDQGQPTRDLNLPTTCYGESDRGCRIRQVASSVRVVASGFAQFTTRARGDDCE